jgi:hypothetical protein
MTKKRKRNHWVPQSYLRAFAADPEGRQKIWRFSKNEGEPELKPIEKVAVRFYLYAPRTANGERDYSFEEKLSELENWLGDPVWSQLCHEMVDLGWQPLRKMVALMVAVMYLRNLAQLGEWVSLHRQIVDSISNVPDLPEYIEIGGRAHSFDRDSWPASRDAGPEELKRSWINNIRGAAWLAEILMKMRWAVVLSDEPVFITSDNPVTVLHPSLKFRGFADPETSVIFPLSPTRVLNMDNLHNQPDGHYYPVNPGPAALNLLQWRRANEHMFSHREIDLVCRELLCAAETGELG